MAPPPSHPQAPPRARSRLGEVTVLVLWMSCLVVGLVGFAIPYALPSRSPSDHPLIAQSIEVQLAPFPPLSTPHETHQTPAAPQRSQPLSPPRMPPLAPLPQLPNRLAVSEPMPGTAPVVLPVDRPSVNPTVSPLQANSQTSSPPQTLTFGLAEGKQPAPDYPREARLGRQEGTVGVRLIVGENGRVLSAEARHPSPWPLLNQSAVHTVLRRWRFRPGPIRVFDVPIRFELAAP